MSNKKRPRGKKFFTAAQANNTLPLVRAITRDISELACGLRDRQERLNRLGRPRQGHLGEAYQEELERLREDLDRSHLRMQEYVQELNALGIELKDYYIGLVDFPARMNGREVYLCWKLGEPTVAFWHERDAGFAGRQRLKAEVHST
jgi:hypothetical protein